PASPWSLTAKQGRPSSAHTTAAAAANPSTRVAGTHTLPGNEVGRVRAIQNPAGPGSATTIPRSGSAPVRCSDARAPVSGTASDSYSGVTTDAIVSYSGGRVGRRYVRSQRWVSAASCDGGTSCTTQLPSDSTGVSSG